MNLGIRYTYLLRCIAGVSTGRSLIRNLLSHHPMFRFVSHVMWARQKLMAGRDDLTAGKAEVEDYEILYQRQKSNLFDRGHFEARCIAKSLGRSVRITS